MEWFPNLVYSKEKIFYACQREKQIKSSFKTKPVEPSTKPLNLHHVDLFGPVDLVSINGRKYTVVVVDEYTRYPWIVFMKIKNEIKKKLPKLMKLVQNEKRLSILKIISDHGREFVNHVIKKYCENNGIMHQLSSAITPQHNRVTERKNRTVKEASKTMIIEVGLPKKFWVEVVQIACHLKKLHNDPQN